MTSGCPTNLTFYFYRQSSSIDDGLRKIHSCINVSMKSGSVDYL